MSHNYTPQCDSLYTDLRRAKSAISVLAESNRGLAKLYCGLAKLYCALAESHRSVLEEKEAQDETIKDQQQVIDDLNRKLDCQPNYCENDGSSNCAMSRSRRCYG